MHLHREGSLPLRVALLGLGTVGGAVAARLLDPGFRDDVAARGLVPPQLVAVGVRDPGRPRAVALPADLRVTDDLRGLATDADVDVVVELLGGLEPAGDAVGAALDAGKGVVTANKHLLARRGAELEARARAAGASLRFEAAVAGGVPVLSPLVRDLTAGRVTSLRGIVNGTTNHILTAMAEGGRDVEDALREAQARGYAEADPTADLSGEDAADKLAILTRLAFGGWPAASDLRRAAPAFEAEPCPGITGVTSRQLAHAADLGLTLKLVARASRSAGKVRAAVTLMAVRSASPLGSCAGVTNVVEVTAEPVGRICFWGQGAGGPQTAGAVLGDVLALGRGEGSTWGALPPAAGLPVEDDLDGDQAWFFAFEDLGGVPVPQAISELALAGSDGAYVTRPVSLAVLGKRLEMLGLPVAIYPVLPDA